jgi:hypothetical protein
VFWGRQSRISIDNPEVVKLAERCWRLGGQSMAAEIRGKQRLNVAARALTDGMKRNQLLRAGQPEQGRAFAGEQDAFQ